MIPDLLLFPLFLGLLYAGGKGVFRLAGLQKEMPLYAYVLAPLFCIGGLAVVWNFAAGVASPWFWLPFAALLALGLKPSTQDKNNILVLAVLGFLLAPVAAMMNPGADAGLYHLPHQLWIRQEKIVIGLANFHSRFGFSSFLEYIYAPLWLGTHFKLVSYTAASFVVALCLFLLQGLQSQKPQIVALSFITALSLILHSKFLDFDYTSTDTPSAIVFTITFLSGLVMLMEGTQVSTKKLTWFFISALACFMMKVSYATLAVWVIFVAVALCITGKSNLKSTVQAAALPAMFAIIWLIRGVMVSGCVLYPVTASCLNLPWTALANAQENSEGITWWARCPPRSCKYDPESWNWITQWWLNYHTFFLAMTALSLILTLAGYRYFFRARLPHRHHYRPILLSALVYLCGTLVLWFVKAPGIRFANGLFMVLPTVITLTIFGIGGFEAKPWMDRLKRWLLKHLPVVEKKLYHGKGAAFFAGTLVMLILILAYDGRMYSSRAIRNSLLFNSLPATFNVVVDPHPSGFGVKPREVECWLVPHCGWDTRPPIEERWGYRYMRSREAP